MDHIGSNLLEILIYNLTCYNNSHEIIVIMIIFRDGNKVGRPIPLKFCSHFLPHSRVNLVGLGWEIII